VFRLILVRDGCEGVVYRRIPIAHREMHVDDESVPDNTFCEVCGRADREDRLLLCDGCDLGLESLWHWPSVIVCQTIERLIIRLVFVSVILQLGPKQPTDDVTVCAHVNTLSNSQALPWS